jgi:antitoxin (DNA-binding transcriptional repressor) of toxin-antitoxin stability system
MMRVLAARGGGLRLIVKVIPLSEAKAKLSRYGQLCREEPVPVTVNGRASFQLVPLAEEDDLVDRLIEHHPAFRRLLEARLRKPSVSVATATGRLGSRRSGSGRIRPQR